MSFFCHHGQPVATIRSDRQVSASRVRMPPTPATQKIAFSEAPRSKLKWDKVRLNSLDHDMIASMYPLIRYNQV